jgi:hypothetical protein
LRRFRQVKVVDAVRRCLTEHPVAETRQQKPLRPNSVASRELRLGDLRVYYDFEYEPERVVRVLAIGVKTRGIVRIGGRVIAL